MSQINPGTILAIIGLYFALLVVISYFTSRNADNKTFFTADKNSPWLLVAIGMIGATLSGVTFISVPGAVGNLGAGNSAFSYMQMVFGFMVGYFIIATVLMPIYYRLNLTSIYGYLNDRFGRYAYLTGAGFFLLSRLIGASLRLYLVAIVLQKFVMDPLGVHFVVTVVVTILLIWIYTFQGGIKTIVVTDTLQTVCMISAVVLTIYFIADAMDLSGVGEIVSTIKNSDYSQMFFFEGGWSDPNNFWKQFISGALIALVMTGLDQDMMQKNLTCKSLKDAQKNMFFFSIALIFAKMLFISLGALLYIFAAHKGFAIPEASDQLYPSVAFEHLPAAVGVIFVLGLVAAAYSSADSALTSLTTSFCVDFLGFENSDASETDKKKTRFKVHVAFSFLLLAIILITYYAIENRSIINQVFRLAGYTYGPILGMFAFGILTKRKIMDVYSIVVAVVCVGLTILIDMNSASWFGGLTLGHMSIALNGLLTFIGLLIISKPHLRKQNTREG